MHTYSDVHISSNNNNINNTPSRRGKNQRGETILIAGVSNTKYGNNNY